MDQRGAAMGSNGLWNRKIIGVFLGTLVEVYDYALYGFCVGMIADKFFLKEDLVTNFLKTYATYAVAYLSKPIGALFFGSIGDKYGRKTALSMTIIGIALPTMVIGLLPTYAAIGRWSTCILILCRFLQGIFWGGEYDGAAIYVIEHLGKRLQFMASAITRCIGALGLLLAVGMVDLFNAPIFPTWGWRIPFLLSFPLALVTFYYRRQFDETPSFKALKERKVHPSNLRELLQRNWRTIGMVIGLSGSIGATYQIAIVFMRIYLPMVVKSTAWVMPIFSILMIKDFIVCMFVAGLVADRVGPMIVIRVAAVGTILAGLLLIVAIQCQVVNLALGASIMLASCVAPFNALAHAVVVDLFAVHERYRAVGLGHTIGSMLFSGSASYVCMHLFRWKPYMPMVYLSVLAFILAYLVKRLHAKKQSTLGSVS